MFLVYFKVYKWLESSFLGLQASIYHTTSRSLICSLKKPLDDEICIIIINY